MTNRLRALLRQLVDAEVVRQPRYRAWERRHVRSAARAGSVVLIVVLLIDAASWSSTAPAITALNLPLAVVGAALFLVLRRSGPRRNPTGAAILLGATALATSLLPLGLVPEAGTIQMAYVPLVVVASALFIPWNTTRHMAWTFLCLAMVFGFVLSPFAARLDGAAINDLVTITIDSLLVSVGGHLVLQRQRRSMYLQKVHPGPVLLGEQAAGVWAAGPAPVGITTDAEGERQMSQVAPVGPG